MNVWRLLYGVGLSLRRRSRMAVRWLSRWIHVQGRSQWETLRCRKRPPRHSLSIRYSSPIQIRISCTRIPPFQSSRVYWKATTARSSLMGRQEQVRHLPWKARMNLHPSKESSHVPSTTSSNALQAWVSISSSSWVWATWSSITRRYGICCLRILSRSWRYERNPRVECTSRTSVSLWSRMRMRWRRNSYMGETIGL